MKRFKVTIIEKIEHVIEVEEINEHMAKEEAKKIVKQRMIDRIWGNMPSNIQIEELPLNRELGKR